METKKKEKRPPIDSMTKLKLWVRSGGRCQYKGCNEILYRDDKSFGDLNKSYIAHIYGFEKNSARYDAVKSPKLAKDFRNLMLLCDSCHRKIDREEKDSHPAPLLIDMKKEHEDRIENLTAIKDDVKTNVIIYTTKIGTFNPEINFPEVRQILAKKNLYPSNEAITLGHSSPIDDSEELYWDTEVKILERNFSSKVQNVFDNPSYNNHFSLFALAPQPLLIKLGTLLPDMFSVDVYQKHREPDTWEWQSNADFGGFFIEAPDNFLGMPVLNISLSADIDNSRIMQVVDEKISIWKLTIKNPNNNFLSTEKILSEFRAEVRKLFNWIKIKHGQKSVLKVFPCMPNSASLEFGRVWMPKSDVDMEIYDERNGFKKALVINKK